MDDLKIKATSPDVIVIGAGPVGAYIAGRMGYGGVTVWVFEKRARSEVKKELGYIHFDVNSYDMAEIPRPGPNNPIYFGTFNEGWQIPLTEDKRFSVPFKTDILSMNGFVNWIGLHAEKSGNVRFFYAAPYIGPIVDGSQVKGVVIEGIGEVTAKLVIDCSGRKAVVRNSLPHQCGVPKLKARESRTFNLHMEKWKCLGDYPSGSNTYVCFKGFANQVGPFETLVGMSTLISMKHTKKMHKKFSEYHLKEVDHEITDVYSGKVPYDFPPSTLVGDGFLSAGDAAFQNKPFNGEGMASGMEAVKIAVPVILEAIKNGRVGRNDLWAYNKEYFRGIGAKFAMIRGSGETLVDLTPEEMDWIYRAGFVTKKDILSTWLHYTVHKGPWSLLKTALRGIGNLDLFRRIYSSVRFGLALSMHYRKYPITPDRLQKWEEGLRTIFLRYHVNCPMPE